MRKIWFIIFLNQIKNENAEHLQTKENIETEKKSLCTHNYASITDIVKGKICGTFCFICFARLYVCPAQTYWSILLFSLQSLIDIFLKNTNSRIFYTFYIIIKYVFFMISCQFNIMLSLVIPQEVMTKWWRDQSEHSVIKNTITYIK